MNRHIDDILIDLDKKEDIYSNNEISEHLNECERCRMLFDKYLDMIEVVRHNTQSIKLTEEDADKVFHNIITNPQNGVSEQKFKIRVIAIAAAILLIISSGFYIFKLQQKSPESIDEKHLISILQSEKNEDLDIIKDFELFSNLELIENLDELEELREVLDDEI